MVLSAGTTNYNHSCGSCGLGGWVGWTIEEEEEQEVEEDDDDARPLEGMEKGVFTQQRYTPAPPRTDLDGNLRHSEALAKKIG